MRAQPLFDALSDENRRAILTMLMRQGELCVCNIYSLLNMSQPKASRHLAVLRDADLVVARRDGKWMHYRLNPEMPLWSYRLLEAMRDGIPDWRSDGNAPAAVNPAPSGCGALGEASPQTGDRRLESGD